MSLAIYLSLRYRRLYVCFLLISFMYQKFHPKFIYWDKFHVQSIFWLGLHAPLSLTLLLTTINPLEIIRGKATFLIWSLLQRWFFFSLSKLIILSSLKIFSLIFYYVGPQSNGLSYFYKDLDLWILSTIPVTTLENKPNLIWAHVFLSKNTLQNAYIRQSTTILLSHFPWCYRLTRNKMCITIYCKLQFYKIYYTP